MCGDRCDATPPESISLEEFDGDVNCSSMGDPLGMYYVSTPLSCDSTNDPNSQCYDGTLDSVLANDAAMGAAQAYHDAWLDSQEQPFCIGIDETLAYPDSIVEVTDIDTTLTCTDQGLYEPDVPEADLQAFAEAAHQAWLDSQVPTTQTCTWHDGQCDPVSIPNLPTEVDGQVVSCVDLGYAEFGDITSAIDACEGSMFTQTMSCYSYDSVGTLIVDDIDSVDANGNSITCDSLGYFPLNPVGLADATAAFQAEYEANKVGCTDPTADNYDPTAITDDGDLYV